jgi:hypothetical protein
MRAITRSIPDGHGLTLRTARYSQAVVIDVMDRLARDPASGRPRLLGRLWRTQLKVGGLLVDEPVQLVDRLYAVTDRLVSLHREFAHRLFEAIDTRDDPHPHPRETRPAASVTSLTARRAK